MNASKESGQEALNRFNLLPIDPAAKDEDVEFIRTFLEAAIRKLPHETSFPDSKKAHSRRRF